LDIFERIMPDSLEAAEAHAAVSGALGEEGDLAGAAKHCVLAVAGYRHAQNEEALGDLLARCANIELQQARLDAARPLLEEAQRLAQRGHFSPKTEAAIALAHVFYLYSSGDKPGAEREASQLLTRVEQLPPRWQAARIDVLEALANSYYDNGRFDDAERLIRRALLLVEKQSDAPSYVRARLENDLGMIYARSDGDEAERHLERAIDLQVALGGESLLVVHHRSNLATLYRERRKFEKATAQFQQAAAAIERLKAAGHPVAATVWENWAGLLALQGDDKHARELSRRALELQRKLRGKSDPEVRRLEHVDAYVRALTGDPRAHDKMLALTRAELRHIADEDTKLPRRLLLPLIDDSVHRDRLVWMTSHHPERWAETYELALQAREIGPLILDLQRPAGAHGLSDVWWKGPGQGGATEWHDRLDDARRADDVAPRRAEGRVRLPTLRDVCERIGADGAWLHIAEEYDFPWRRDDGGGWRYHAYVLVGGRGCERRVERLDLGTVESVDRAVGRLLRLLDWPRKDGATPEELEPPLREVYELVWQKVAPALRKRAHVTLLLEGLLQRAPFYALGPNLGEDLHERGMRFQLVDHWRWNRAPRRKHDGPLLVVAPDFSRPGSLFPERPELRAAAKQLLNKPSDIDLTRGNADKAAVMRELVRSRQLLFATHGFADPGVKRAADNPFDQLQATLTRAAGSYADPSLRAGLALDAGEPPALLAADIEGMDLRGLDRAALMACESGKIDLDAVDGVGGMRGAFLAAGAGELLASQWQIEEMSAAAVARGFFAGSGDWAGLLEKAKQSCRATGHLARDLPHPSCWAPFVLVSR
jgi:tetratricopeptide (TPR) repeat protein/CHAT domain-containing protein